MAVPKGTLTVDPANPQPDGRGTVGVQENMAQDVYLFASPSDPQSQRIARNYLLKRKQNPKDLKRTPISGKPKPPPKTWVRWV